MVSTSLTSPFYWGITGNLLILNIVQPLALQRINSNVGMTASQMQNVLNVHCFGNSCSLSRVSWKNSRIKMVGEGGPPHEMWVSLLMLQVIDKLWSNIVPHPAFARMRKQASESGLKATPSLLSPPQGAILLGAECQGQTHTWRQLSNPSANQTWMAPRHYISETEAITTKDGKHTESLESDETSSDHKYPGNMQETTCGDKGVEFNVGFLFLNPNGILWTYCYAFVFLTSSLHRRYVGSSLPHHLRKPGVQFKSCCASVHAISSDPY